MDTLFYNKKHRIAISSDPFIPLEKELVENEMLDNEPLYLDEWKYYYIKFFGEEVPDYFKQAPFFKKCLQKNLFEINFKNFVGYTQINDISLVIENKKIGNELYDSILNYITQKYAGLVFSFGSPVGLTYKKVNAGKDVLFIQYLFLKNYLLDQDPNIDEIGSLILSRPNRKILSETHRCPINEVDSLNPLSSLDFFSSADKMCLLRDGHSLLSTRFGKLIYGRTGKKVYLSEMQKNRKYYTYDTIENRFVKYFLKEIIKKINVLELSLSNKHGTYLNPEISKNIQLIKSKVSYLLSHSLWHDVGKMTFPPIQSTVLQRREGYRHLFQLFSLLQLATNYQPFSKDFRSLIEIKDVPTLYEYWCFFVIKDILDEKFKPTQYKMIVRSSETEDKIQEGVEICYEFNIKMLYNYSFSGSLGSSGNLEINNYKSSESYSHRLIPDIVIVREDNEKLIFDAKYKGKTNGDIFYGEEINGVIDNYKEDDLNKMHTYRDAIENVYGAFALYPGNNHIFFPSHNAKSIYHGVGAMPLIPLSGGKTIKEHFKKLKEMITRFLQESE